MPTGLTKDAGWQIGVSRTLPHEPSAVWRFIISKEGLARWLGPGASLPHERGATYRTSAGVGGEVRGFSPGRRVRVTHGGSTIQVSVTSADHGRTVLRFHQERLSGAGERARQKAHWQQVIDEVAAALDA